MVFQRSMLHWRSGGGVKLPWVYVHCAISDKSAKFGVAVVKASMPN